MSPNQTIINSLFQRANFKVMLVICFLVSASSCSLISKEYGLRVQGKFLPDLHGRFFPDGLDEKSLNEKVIVDIDFNCNRYHRFMVGPPILQLTMDWERRIVSRL